MTANITSKSLQQLTSTTLLFVSGLSLAGSLMPAEVHKPEPLGNYRFHLGGSEFYTLGGERFSKTKQLAVLENFAMKLLSETQDLEPEIAHAINDNFWDLYEPI